MKITRQQLRKVIKEAITSDPIYLDDFTSDLFGVKYYNQGEQCVIFREDFARLKSMNQYDATHQKIFTKYERSPETVATGAGYGWWELK